MFKAISDDIKQIIFEISQKSSFSIDVLETETDQDHIHMLLNISPQFAISSIVNRLKSIATYRIWKLHYAYLKQQFWKEYTFWSDGYFVCSIGKANSDTIRQYIKTQRLVRLTSHTLKTCGFYGVPYKFSVLAQQSKHMASLVHIIPSTLPAITHF